ncbi:MAG: cyanophycinase [Planctomycetota bacterium]
MKPTVRVSLASYLLLFSSFITGSNCLAEPVDDPLVRPIDGSRMVVGDGNVPDYILDYYLFLCGDAFPEIVVINLDGETGVSSEQFRNRGAESVLVVETIPSDLESLTLSLLSADGVWIEGSPDALAKRPLLLSLLQNVTKRNGTIAVDSSSVSLLADLDENDAAKRLESPFANFDFHFGMAKPDNSSSVQDVHCMIPNSSALVVHQGRQIAGYGDRDITLMVKAANGWPERTQTFECPDAFGPGGYPGYSTDLLSWVRSARERSRAFFPPKLNPASAMENGTLFLHGGSRLHQDVLEEFVALAGGKEVPFVCIPSASQFDAFETPRSYSAESLNEMGCSQVTILHTDDPMVADQSEAFARMLEDAAAVWIDGGRTFRFMDSYEGTRVPKLLAQVLERGGVVGGSSAGCQVPSDFLVRGNPTSNRDIAFGGYTRGMGLLKGVIIDAHFLQRQRHEPFLQLMQKHPQMLGIGIDESTALVVNGHQGRVVGNAAVSFYDLSGKTEDEFKPVILNAGQSYDLRARQTISD